MTDKVLVQVEITREGDGIYSDHAIVEGAQEALQWPGAGMPQVSMAMLTETIRHEAKHQILLRMSNDPEYRAKVQGGIGTIPEDEAVDMAHEIADAALNWLVNNTRQMAAEVAFQTLQTVASL